MLLYCTHISVTAIIGKKQTHRGQPFNSQLGPWVTLYRKRTTPKGLGDRGFPQWRDNAQGQANNGEQVQMDAFKSSIPLGRAPGWACRSPLHAGTSTLSLKNSASGLAWRTKGPPTDFMHHTMLLHSVKSPSHAHIDFLTAHSQSLAPGELELGWSPALYTLVAAICEVWACLLCSRRGRRDC